jgi:nucleoside-diphosphate-sugar epimerase
MVKVLVLGATGYIGLPLSQSLLRSSHTVYGLSRTPQKAHQLSLHEIIPVSGSSEDSAAYTQLIRDHRIDVVVDCTGVDASNSIRTIDNIARLGKERMEADRPGGWPTAKLGYIYVSGMWVHGSSAQPVNDLSPVGVPGAPAQPPSIVAWRPTIERLVLAQRDTLDVMIVRPAVVYGRNNPIWNFLFEPLLEAAKGNSDAPISVKADPQATIPLVHLDDTVSGLHRAVERLPLISGTGVWPVFDLVTSRESLRIVVEAAGRALGFHHKVVCAGPGDDALAKAMGCCVMGDSNRARDLLGWHPKIGGMVDGIEKYALSFRAMYEVNPGI